MIYFWARLKTHPAYIIMSERLHCLKFTVLVHKINKLFDSAVADNGVNVRSAVASLILFYIKLKFYKESKNLK